MAKIDASSLVEQMRALAFKAQGDVTVPKTGADIDKFGNILMDQIKKVNDTQVATHDLQEKFVSGDSEASLAQVMVAMQKSEIYTQFLVEGRNKVVAAYNDIMNMSV